MKPEIKKLLILNLPYLLFVWLFDKVGAAVRLSPGAEDVYKRQLSGRFVYSNNVRLEGGEGR